MRKLYSLIHYVPRKDAFGFYERSISGFLTEFYSEAVIQKEIEEKQLKTIDGRCCVEITTVIVGDEDWDFVI